MFTSSDYNYKRLLETGTRTIDLAATTPGQSGYGSNGNEGVLCISQSSSITGTSPSDCLGHSLEESLQRCSRCILEPKPTGQRECDKTYQYIIQPITDIIRYYQTQHIEIQLPKYECLAV